MRLFICYLLACAVFAAMVQCMPISEREPADHIAFEASSDTIGAGTPDSLGQMSTIFSWNAREQVWIVPAFEWSTLKAESLRDFRNRLRQEASAKQIPSGGDNWELEDTVIYNAAVQLTISLWTQHAREEFDRGFLEAAVMYFHEGVDILRQERVLSLEEYEEALRAEAAEKGITLAEDRIEEALDHFEKIKESSERDALIYTFTDNAVQNCQTATHCTLM